ncbi:MAG: DUF2510 domain-containing protein [Actinomycetia bacterium]|nr:DUF2510 domain-containing protein [Actinomycetes bacterium]MCP4961720.1 DUF2510 domain-containing protein [Actinomycetes bacterium]
MPAPGWYSDPAGGGGLRYWDGQTWTSHTASAPVQPVQPPPQSVQPVGPPPGPPPSSPPRAPSSPPPAPSAPPPAQAAPAQQPGVEAVNSAGLDHRVVMTLIGAAVVFVGSVLPWVDFDGFTQSGFETNLPWALTGAPLDSSGDGVIAHGWLFVILAGLAAASVLGKFGDPLLSSICGGIVVLLALADFWRFNQALEGSDTSILDVIGYGFYVTVVGGALLVAGWFMARSSGR